MAKNLEMVRLSVYLLQYYEDKYYLLWNKHNFVLFLVWKMAIRGKICLFFTLKNIFDEWNKVAENWLQEYVNIYQSFIYHWYYFWWWMKSERLYLLKHTSTRSGQLHLFTKWMSNICFKIVYYSIYIWSSLKCFHMGATV